VIFSGGSKKKYFAKEFLHIYSHMMYMKGCVWTEDETEFFSLLSPCHRWDTCHYIFKTI